MIFFRLPADIYAAERRHADAAVISLPLIAGCRRCRSLPPADIFAAADAATLFSPFSPRQRH